MARRCASRSSARLLIPCQSTNERDRAIVVMRLRTSFASASVPCVPASSILRRRLAVALPCESSISSSANRAAPSASRFCALSVDLGTVLSRLRIWTTETPIPRLIAPTEPVSQTIGNVRPRRGNDGGPYHPPFSPFGSRLQADNWLVLADALLAE